MSKLKPFLSNGFRQNNAVVYYHDNCPDGVVSAIIATAALEEANGARAVLPLPMTYNGKVLRPSFEGKQKGHQQGLDMYFVDICPTPEQLAELMTRNPRRVDRERIDRIVIIDHHASVLKNHAELVHLMEQPSEVRVELYFAGVESGASLTHAYFEDMLKTVPATKQQHLRTLADALRVYDLWLHDGVACGEAFIAVGVGQTYAQLTADLKEIRDAAYEAFHGTLSNAEGYELVKELGLRNIDIFSQLYTRHVKDFHAAGQHRIMQLQGAAYELAGQGTIVSNHQGCPFVIVNNVPADTVNELAVVMRNIPRFQELPCGFVVTLNTRGDNTKFSLRKIHKVANHINLGALAECIAPAQEGRHAGGGHRDSAAGTIHSNDPATIERLLMEGINKFFAPPPAQ